MNNENLATLRDTESEAGSLNLEVGSQEKEASQEGANMEMQNQIQQEKANIEQLGKALPDDPEALSATQAAIIELDEVREKYSKRLDSVTDPEADSATVREPAKVYDFREEKTLREQRTSLRLGFESSRSERLRKRMEHQAPPTMRVVTLREDVAPTIKENTEIWEPQPPATPQAETLRSPELTEVTEPALPFKPETSAMAESIRETQNENESEIPVVANNEADLRATMEGLKELSGDEWTDLYKTDLPWTEEVWTNLENETVPGGVSQREELRQLSINKAELGLRLATNALALKQLADLGMNVPEGHNLLLEKRKLEESLEQDKAKERKLFEAAQETAESMDVEVGAEAPEAPVDAKPAFKRYTDEELEKMARESVPQKAPSKVGKFVKHAAGGALYGGAAIALAIGAKAAWSILSGKAMSKALDWIDKGMEKIQKYAFKNDFSSIFDIAKDTGNAIHNKLDNLNKEEKKSE